jgi:phosphoribosylaminoimidazole-succinocarboxamide synthase
LQKKTNSFPFILEKTMSSTINDTNFNFPKQKSVYKGKVREVYNIDNDLLVMVATDRLSAFDVIMPRQIPFKGQILNQIAAKMLEATKDLVPNWVVATPDPNVTVGHMCDTFKVEMVIRGYLTGHAWREYKSGKRELCGVMMPEGMIENQKFEKPIITPSTKAAIGDHDEDISREEILAKGIVSKEDYLQLEEYTYALFQRGTEIAAKQGLILVDTKYEFGRKNDGTIVVIDEIHTPDSSRYFYAEGYEAIQAKDQKQKQLSKEFVREWLIENNFQGKEGQQVPEISEAKIEEISNRYIELYEKITGEAFQKGDVSNLLPRIEANVSSFLQGV